jgi:Ca-activated chloride channel family protein
MKKTAALFAAAGALVVGALALDLWYTFAHRAQSAPAPSPAPLTLAPPPTDPTARPSAARIGELVTADLALAQPLVAAATPSDTYLRVDLSAASVPGATRAPLNLAIVLDRSGSMAGDKIERARASAKQLVERLADEDRVSIVTYATDYAVDLPLTRVGDARARILRVIDGIVDGGGTNISGGLESAIAELERGRGAGAASRVVLMSDGNANQGITDPRALGELARRARERGISVSSLGVGLDFNEDVMTILAESGGGAYHYVREAQDIAVALDAELSSMAALAARSVELSVELAPGWSVREVYGYRTEQRGSRLVIPVGDMAAQTRRQIVVRLGVPAAQPGPLATLSAVLSYSAADGSAPREFHAALGVSASTDATAVAASERRDVVEAAEAVLAAEARRHAAATFQAGNKGEALNTLRIRTSETRARAAALSSPKLAAQAQEMEQALRELDAADVASDSGKDLVKREKARAREIFAY